VNCLMSNDLSAAATNCRTGSTPSSGWTITRGENACMNAGC
jgi:hypothetical protein